MIRRIRQWIDDRPSLHKHDVTELTETLQRHREEGFSYTTVHRTWWCPICKRSWKQWHFFTNQDRQIFDHIQKLQLQRLAAELKEQERRFSELESEFVAWRRDAGEFLSKEKTDD